MSAPHVTTFFHKPTNTFSYAVWDPDSMSGAIIDPVLDYDAAAGRTGNTSAREIVDFVRRQKLTIDWILETHAHADHLSAAPFVKDELGGHIAIGKGIRAVQDQFRDIYNLGPEFPVDGSQFDHLFDDDEVFAVGGIQARAIPTPGHTSDSLTYLIGDAAFVGDSLFMPDAGTARCDFPGGDARVLWQSSRRLFELPDETRLFMCHDYGPGGREIRNETTVGEQKRHNIHVGAGCTEAEFVRRRRERDATLGMPRLILPSVQVNIRAGEIPGPESNGISYLKIPLDRF